ncbi:hypothetical protein [Deferrisoma sp.]
MVRFLACACIGLMLQACSVVMATRQPTEKDLSVLRVGTPRSALIAEFGSPVHTEESDGKKKDIFKFVQGYSTGAKAGRALLHGTADVLTLGLWEVIGTPTEAIFDGKEVAFEVTYDENNRVETVTPLKVTE